MSHEVHLAGCTPTPLAHYLKALGILRLVAEQADPVTTGHWAGEHFVLRTRLPREELQRFFLEQYRPTPIIAPWNAGSGFYYQEKKLKEKDPATGKRIKTGVRNQPTEATRALNRTLWSEAARLGDYREVICRAQEAVRRFELEQAPQNWNKDQFIRYVRGHLPETFLAWMDAALMLTGDETDFPPLLGTGGNDGNLDFTSNFMQRLADLFDFETGSPAAAAPPLLSASLFADPVQSLADSAIGQFAPGAAGGPNATTGFESSSLTNPWDLVLLLEGTLLFAAAVTRRLEGRGASYLSYPFTVRATGAGSGSSATSDESSARAEIWLPLWEQPATLDEIRAMLSEGRVTLGRRPARDGLDFARAVAALGVDRGIAAFQRYAFLMRSGKAYLATPLGQMPVRRNPEADLITDLDDPRGRFLERLRKSARDDNAPGHLSSLVHRLENSLFALTKRPDRTVVQNVLILLGAIEHAVALSPREHDSIPPVPPLSEAWAIKANDGSAEFRIAAALAGLSATGETDHDGQDRTEKSDSGRFLLPMRVHLAPLKWDKGRWQWDAESRLAVWGEGDLATNLIRVLDRRLLESDRLGLADKPFAFTAGAYAADVAAFLARETDDRQIAELLAGLALVRMPRHLPAALHGPEATALPAAYAVLKPFFTPDSLLRYLKALPPENRLPLKADLVARLRAGRTDEALRLSWQRLGLSGVSVPRHPAGPPESASVSGPRLLAALMVPLWPAETGRLLRTITPHKRTETAAEAV